LGLWRAVTAASLVAAACLAVIVVVPRPAPSPVAPPLAASVVLTATLTDKDGKPLFVATADPRTEAVIVVPVGAIAARDRAQELWVIPAGGAPRPIGLLGVHPHALQASAKVRDALAPKAVLAVSLEPPGGSPTGAPTGPVIATGQIEAL
jgi:anti-sigma-K factor RskA